MTDAEQARAVALDLLGHSGAEKERLIATALAQARAEGRAEGRRAGLEILTSLVTVVGHMKVPQTIADAALQLVIVGPILKRAQDFIAKEGV